MRLFPSSILEPTRNVLPHQVTADITIDIQQKDRLTTYLQACSYLLEMRKEERVITEGKVEILHLKQPARKTAVRSFWKVLGEGTSGWPYIRQI